MWAELSALATAGSAVGTLMIAWAAKEQLRKMQEAYQREFSPIVMPSRFPRSGPGSAPGYATDLIHEGFQVDEQVRMIKILYLTNGGKSPALNVRILAASHFWELPPRQHCFYLGGPSTMIAPGEQVKAFLMPSVLGNAEFRLNEVEGWRSWVLIPTEVQPSANSKMQVEDKTLLYKLLWEDAGHNRYAFVVRKNPQGEVVRELVFPWEGERRGRRGLFRFK